MLGSAGVSSIALNGTTGLWLLRDSVIWVATGGVSICVRSHQHELRQRTVRNSANIAAVLCTHSFHQTVNVTLHTGTTRRPFALTLTLITLPSL